MNILVSNDDGIQANGIAKLTETLSGVADVYVIAPSRQRSASSHGLSLSDEVVFHKVEDYPYAKDAYMVDGTPADCVKIGISLLESKGVHIDMVYSGINHGGNLGSDNIYSGTVSAAAEGMILGLPAVALSINAHDVQHFEGACKAALMVLPMAAKTGGQGFVVNINTPDIPAEEIKGLKPAKLGVTVYDQWYYVESKTDDTITYRYRGKPRIDESWEDDMDTKLILEGYATISAIKYDLNDYENKKTLESWELDWK